MKISIRLMAMLIAPLPEIEDCVAAALLDAAQAGDIPTERDRATPQWSLIVVPGAAIQRNEAGGGESHAPALIDKSFNVEPFDACVWWVAKEGRTLPEKAEAILRPHEVEIIRRAKAIPPSALGIATAPAEVDQLKPLIALGAISEAIKTMSRNTKFKDDAALFREVERILSDAYGNVLRGFSKSSWYSLIKQAKQTLDEEIARRQR